MKNNENDKTKLLNLQKANSSIINFDCKDSKFDLFSKKKKNMTIVKFKINRKNSKSLICKKKKSNKFINSVNIKKSSPKKQLITSKSSIFKKIKNITLNNSTSYTSLEKFEPKEKGSVFNLINLINTFSNLLSSSKRKFEDIEELFYISYELKSKFSFENNEILTSFINLDIKENSDKRIIEYKEVFDKCNSNLDEIIKISLNSLNSDQKEKYKSLDYVDDNSQNIIKVNYLKMNTDNNFSEEIIEEVEEERDLDYSEIDTNDRITNLPISYINKVRKLDDINYKYYSPTIRKIRSLTDGKSKK